MFRHLNLAGRFLDFVIICALACVLAGIFAPKAEALGSCDEGYWAITAVETNLDFDYQTADMGMHVDQVSSDLWVGTFYLNDGWLTFSLDAEGAGSLNRTTFEGFLGTTRTISDSVYFIPEDGEAGFTRPGNWAEKGMWHCVLSDYCVRQFEIEQLTSPCN